MQAVTCYSRKYHTSKGMSTQTPADAAAVRPAPASSRRRSGVLQQGGGGYREGLSYSGWFPLSADTSLNRPLWCCSDQCVPGGQTAVLQPQPHPAGDPELWQRQSCQEDGVSPGDEHRYWETKALWPAYTPVTQEHVTRGHSIHLLIVFHQ